MDLQLEDENPDFSLTANMRHFSMRWKKKRKVTLYAIHAKSESLSKGKGEETAI